MIYIMILIFYVQITDSTPLECTFEKHYKCFMKNVDNDDFDWSEKMVSQFVQISSVLL